MTSSSMHTAGPTDRELLELAAKAAGIDLEWEAESFASATMSYRVDEEGDQIPWDPLEDDGDALRLAVKLNLLFMPYPFDKAVRVVNSKNADNTVVSWGTPPDPEAATRRAIVRAAAEIGRTP